MYSFKIVPHLFLSGRDREMIECWRDGVFVAGIYPHPDGLRVVSKYRAGAVRDEDPLTVMVPLRRPVRRPE